jgi:hypothetical protein
MDKMDELILASLQELCVPPANNANFDNHSAGPAKRSYKKHGADATKKGVCQVAGCDHSLLTAYAKVHFFLFYREARPFRSSIGFFDLPCMKTRL